VPRIYIAGRMTGVPAYNFPAFHAAAAAWREAGWEVYNPAEEFNGDTSMPYRAYVEHDVEALKRVDALAMLDGWDDAEARGSVWEWAIATKLLRIPVYDADDPVDPAEVGETILEEAQRLVHGNRGADYGHPALDFGRTAGMATAMLSDKLREGATITRCDVGMFMILVKLSRLGHRFKRDSVVDIAGYAETLSMVAEWEAQNGA
jgi:hypothetical protein